MTFEHTAHPSWKQRRHDRVTAATGDLSLTETRWFPRGTSPSDAAALVTTERNAVAATPGVTVTEISRTNIRDGHTEYGLRVWNANAPAIAAFSHTDTFDYDPAWRLTGQFTPAEEGRRIPFEHIRDGGETRTLAVPGDITFERDGESFTVYAFNDDGTLLLVFGDPTNTATDADQTYSAGRFLFVERADQQAFDAPGEVILDFNRAFVPPCGFSAQYNCPMPPPQNRLPWPVRAGEKLPVFTGDFDIYSL